MFQLGRTEILTSLQQQVCQVTLWNTETLPKTPKFIMGRPEITTVLTSVMSTNVGGRQNQLPLEALQVLFTTQGRKGITAKPVTISFKVLSEMICFLLSEINKAHLPWKPKSPALLFLKKHTMVLGTIAGSQF